MIEKKWLIALAQIGPTRHDQDIFYLNVGRADKFHPEIIKKSEIKMIKRVTLLFTKKRSPRTERSRQL